MTLTIFSHFDHENKIDDYVIYYLKSLKEISNEIVFVSTSQLENSEQIKLINICTKVIIRENIGYDFMSYKVGLLASGVEYKKFDQIILCNDSVYGSLFPLNKMFIKMNKLKDDCWGIFKSFECKKHLQSFFLVFNKKIIDSNFLFDFFSKVIPLNSKNEIIKNYEIGLSTSLINANFCLNSYIKYPLIINRFIVFYKAMSSFSCKLNKDSSFTVAVLRLFGRFIRNFYKHFLLIILNNKINCSLYFWEYSLKKKCPVIKVELFRRNPTGFFPFSSLITSISKNTNYPISLINKHVKRTKKFYEN